jgi:hypothetical protein
MSRQQANTLQHSTLGNNKAGPVGRLSRFDTIRKRENVSIRYERLFRAKNVFVAF